MKKEIITAAFIGAAIGLLLAGGFLINRSKNLSIPQSLYNPLIEDYPLQNGIKIKFSDGKSHQIDLTSPIDQSVTNNQQTDIIGQTTPESTVVVLNEYGEKIILADSQGNFESGINLTSGENEIDIKSFSPAGTVAEKTITVVVSNFEF